MTTVAGVDFGTLSVRVSLVSSERGRLAACTAEYPLNRRRDDPDFATQSHSDHMRALVAATKGAIHQAGIDGHEIAALAIDTTGSSVVPVDKDLIPLDDYYLWCDHRAWREAAEITETAHGMGVDAINWCGGVYSSEWGFSKLLHWLRSNSKKRTQFATAFEHCDMITAVLSGIKDPAHVKRSVCAMGHKWLWNKSLGGFPPNEFFKAVDPLLDGIGEKLAGKFLTSDHYAGHLSPEWANQMGLRPGIPIPVGAFDAHWDAVGAGIRLGDVVNVIGTSTCIIGISRSTQLVPGVCGVVPGSVYPQLTGIEAGLSATGDVFDAIARRAGVPLADLSKRIENYRAGETGLLRIDWDNGDRTVLVNPELGGITLGWNLTHMPEDELFAAIEGTAFHTRIILERMEEHGVEIRRVINGGGIPRRNALLNQVYANAIGKPILVPESDVTSLGSSIFAFLAAGTYKSIEEAQDALCPKYRVFEPEPRAGAVYRELFPLYRDVYFGFGRKNAALASFGEVLPKLRLIAAKARTIKQSSRISARGSSRSLYTFGNASGIARERVLVAISLGGDIVDGICGHLRIWRLTWLCTALICDGRRRLYALRIGDGVGPGAARDSLFRHTYAEYFHGPVRVTEPVATREIEQDYELSTASRSSAVSSQPIFNRWTRLRFRPFSSAGHAPFC